MPPKPNSAVIPTQTLSLFSALPLELLEAIFSHAQHSSIVSLARTCRNTSIIALRRLYCTVQISETNSTCFFPQKLLQTLRERPHLYEYIQVLHVDLTRVHNKWLSSAATSLPELIDNILGRATALRVLSLNLVYALNTWPTTESPMFIRNNQWHLPNLQTLDLQYACTHAEALLIYNAAVNLEAFRSVSNCRVYSHEAQSISFNKHHRLKHLQLHLLDACYSSEIINLSCHSLVTLELDGTSFTTSTPLQPLPQLRSLSLYQNHNHPFIAALITMLPQITSLSMDNDRIILKYLYNYEHPLVNMKQLDLRALDTPYAIKLSAQLASKLPNLIDFSCSHAETAIYLIPFLPFSVQRISIEENSMRNAAGIITKLSPPEALLRLNPLVLITIECYDRNPEDNKAFLQKIEQTYNPGCGVRYRLTDKHSGRMLLELQSKAFGEISRAEDYKMGEISKRAEESE